MKKSLPCLLIISLVFSLFCSGDSRVVRPVMASEPVKTEARRALTMDEVIKIIQEQLKDIDIVPAKPKEEPKVEVKKPISWVVLKDNKRIDNKAIEEIIKQLDSGDYVAIGTPDVGQEPVRLDITIHSSTDPPIVQPDTKPVVEPSKPVVTPKPDTTLIPTGELHVITVYESGHQIDRQRFDATSKSGSNGVISDPTIRNYLARKCAKGPDGVTPDYRYWDYDTPFAHEPSKTLREMWADAKPKIKHIPCVVIGDNTGVKGIYDLPDVPADSFKLLKSRGGE